MPTAKKTTDETTVKKAPRKAPAKKKVDVDEEVLETQEERASEVAKGGSMLSAVGRRKTAIARVQLVKNGKGMITINAKPMTKAFSRIDDQVVVRSALLAVGQEGAVDISARVTGGGIRGQAEAVRHGIARALVQLDPTFRTSLKKLGFMTRDPRKRERKKFGKKSARRSPQWSKR